MPKFDVAFCVSGYCHYTVTAKNEEEAFEKAKKLFEEDENLKPEQIQVWDEAHMIKEV